MSIHWHPAHDYQVLVACECSGRVRDAFIARGITAISCDTKPTRSPGPHYQGDARDLDLTAYDLVIAHPPCTALGVTADRHYRGTTARDEAIKFFMYFWEHTLDTQRVCIENTVGIMNTIYPCTTRLVRPQYINPYQFGHPAKKKTGLWLRNLPKLEETRVVTPHHANHINNMSGKGEELREKRSVTYQGIADAMAKQWGDLLC